MRYVLRLYHDDQCYKVKVCDATGDAIISKSWFHNKQPTASSEH